MGGLGDLLSAILRYNGMPSLLGEKKSQNETHKDNWRTNIDSSTHYSVPTCYLKTRPPIVSCIDGLDLSSFS